MKYQKIACVADLRSRSASDACKEIMSQYNFLDANSLDISSCDLIVALGGDGLMLKALHRFMDYNIPIYGMNRGSIGFLLNPYNPVDLLTRLENAVEFHLHPLQMVAETIEGQVVQELAVNEVSLLRQTNQAAKIRLLIDGEERINALVADGMLVSTPAGSTAYNFAANGPIIPLGANILALTPISPFRPRRWRGALLSHQNVVECQIMEPHKRPVSAVADFKETRDVVKVTIFQRTDVVLRLLFDETNHIQERIIREQFIT
jgi:NAD+ kinase